MTIPGAPNALASARWRRLIPIAFVTYSFAYLDRSNYSIGAAGGLQRRACTSAPAQSGLLGGLFFLGYFLFQVPAGSFAERRSVQDADVLVADRLGRARRAAGRGHHATGCCSSTGSCSAWSRPSAAGDAGVPDPLVHPAPSAAAPTPS